MALLLITGLNTKEKACDRGTSEKTVRQQASQIRAKANLDNHTELTACLLEGLLLPQGITSTQTQGITSAQNSDYVIVGYFCTQNQ